MKSYQAPCKINLSLKVLGKREDGFHEVDTVMAPLSLCDELQFVKADETTLLCNVPGVPLDESNLVLKAVRLFEKAVGKIVNYEINLIKKIPHGAGLGGGSSDAATTLLALNKLENAGLTTQELITLSAELGSDVGFFIVGGICRCTGRGEKVSPEPSLAGFHETVLLLKPSFPVSTPDAYKRWAGSRELPGITYAPQQLNGLEMVNDLERPVFQKFMVLAEIKQWLLSRDGVKAVMMSGSGSTMFAIVDSASTGKLLQKEALARLDPTLWTWVGTCGS